MKAAFCRGRTQPVISEDGGNVAAFGNWRQQGRAELHFDMCQGALGVLKTLPLSVPVSYVTVFEDASLSF